MQDYAALETVRVEVNDHVALIRMDAPPVNALSTQTLDELTRAFDLVSVDDAVRAVVLTGNGRAFSAGADIKKRAKALIGPADLIAHARRSRECFHSVRECAKPVVAAINGAALGAGLVLAASSDILVASEEAVVGLPEVDLGLAGGSRHAMRLFGHSLLRRMALTGHRIGGAELYRRGIVEACVPAGELLPLALSIAREIASKSPVSTRLGKQTLNAIEEMTLRDGYRYEQDMTAVLARTSDAKEAQRAFVEKRAPVFTGR